MSAASYLTPDAEVPSHRACAHCRSQKVRCIIDDSNSDTCQRCARSGRPCVFTPLQKRKQRKRTDTRVAELEREMRVMQSMLKNKSKDQLTESSTTQDTSCAGPAYGMSQSGGAPNEARENDKASVFCSGDDGIQQQSTLNISDQKASFVPQFSRATDRSLAGKGITKDVVDRDIISMATARLLFETYRIELFPHYPMVPIPSSLSADEMRLSKPTLFLAVIAAAAGKDHPDLSATLDQEVLHTYATKSLLHSQKSLEMVQALLISAVWYYPPNRFGQLKYYEYIHMAATIAMDIGIGTRSVPHRSRFGANVGLSEGRMTAVHPLEDSSNPDLSMTPRSMNPSPDTSSIESRRTFVCCYSVCAQVSISVRRPNMLRMSSYVRECIDHLERSPDALPSDKMLVAWARLIMISEQVSNAFSYDDPGGIASITELRTQLMLKDFAKKLESWFASVSGADTTSTLMIIYWTIRLFLHEIALHVDHSPEDFKAPYQMGVVHPWEGDDIPTQVLAETIAECVNCSHNLINTFLSIDSESLRTLPVLTYVRVSYASFILAKLCLSTNHPRSHIGRVLDQNSIQAEAILDRAILHVQAVLGQARCRVPAIFLALLFKLRQWCQHPELIGPLQGNLLESGMQNPVDEPSGQPISESLNSAETSRVMEQSSTNDSSPQTSLDGQMAFEDLDGVAVRSNSESTSVQPIDRFPAPTKVDSNPAVESLNAEAAALISSESVAPNVTSFFNLNDQMELDQSFFQFFEGMNDVGGADLKSFDDWTSLPTDVLGLSNSLDWQGAISGDENTSL